MPMGRPPKPVELRRKLGTGHRPLNITANTTALAVVPLAEIADGPIIAGLVESGAAAWIGATDMPTVRLAQRLWDDMERLRSALDDEFSESVFRAYRDTVKELRACLSMLGLSPADRSRLGVAEVKARTKLEELMDRRRERAGRRPS